MSTSVSTVQSIYSAFGKGDVSAILSHLADNVIWEENGHDHGIPWLRPGQGKEHAAKFFGTVGSLFHIESFEVKRIFDSGDQVVAQCHIRATIRPTGKTLEDEAEMHLWKVDSKGKVVAFRHVVDTVRHLEVLRATFQPSIEGSSP